MNILGRPASLLASIFQNTGNASILAGFLSFAFRDEGATVNFTLLEKSPLARKGL
jgi:hypothetical protein